MLKPELQYFGQQMPKADSLEKIVMLEKTQGKRRRGPQKRWLDSTTNSMDMNLSKFQETVGTQSLVCYSPWDHKESSGHNLRD